MAKHTNTNRTILLDMSNRMELYIAVTLLFLLLPTNDSAVIKPTPMTKIELLGQEALKHLEDKASSALRPDTGNHSVGCITEAKKHEMLNCFIIPTFSSYFDEAIQIDGLKDDKELHEKLNAIKQRIDDLKERYCKHPADVCKTPFQDKEMTSENLEMLRSILVLTKWFSKPME